MSGTSLSMDESAASTESIGLDALIIAAARDCPAGLLFRDDEEALTARVVADRVQALAVHFRQSGLRPGERILLVTGAQTRGLIALIAALRAGLEPALAPGGLGPVEIAAHARAAEAVALVGPSHYGTLALGDVYLSAAAVSDVIRLVATLGPRAVDGAADFAPVAPGPGEDQTRFGRETATILTFEGPPGAPTVVAHRQSSLFAAALKLVDQALMDPSKSILSTLAPASLAGLVAGPFATLIGAANLVLHGPFEALGFLRAYDSVPGANLVVPESIAPLLDEAGLLETEAGALILVSRFVSPNAFAVPETLAGARAIVDLHAFGEEAVLAQRRDDGAARAPAALYDGSLPVASASRSIAPWRKHALSLGASERTAGGKSLIVATLGLGAFRKVVHRTASVDRDQEDDRCHRFLR